jgi:hypothetical protein
MKEIVIKQGSNEVAIGLLGEETEELPSKGDLYLGINVSSNGYSGKNDLWVLGDEFRKFCKALMVLNEKRKGEAVLAGISPNELEIKIHSVSSLGHMAVSGYTGYEVLGENQSFFHQVRFGFEFDPSLLERIVNNEWVKDNAA